MPARAPAGPARRPARQGTRDRAPAARRAVPGGGAARRRGAATLPPISRPASGPCGRGSVRSRRTAPSDSSARSGRTAPGAGAAPGRSSSGPARGWTGRTTGRRVTAGAGCPRRAGDPASSGRTGAGSTERSSISSTSGSNCSASTSSTAAARIRTTCAAARRARAPRSGSGPRCGCRPDHPSFAAVGGAGEQLCAGALMRHRTLTGICNDIRNPLMGSAGMPFARNVEFEATFPDLGRTELARNRHGTRLGLLSPDPQVISRRLLRRASPSPDTCHGGRGLPGHSRRGALRLQAGGIPQRPGGVLDPVHDPRLVLPPHRRTELVRDDRHGVRHGARRRRRAAADGRGCGPARMPRGGPGRRRRSPRSPIRRRSTGGAARRLARAYRTTLNTVTAWWDASQLYGHDEASRARVKRDPDDRAKLRLPGAQRARGGGRSAGLSARLRGRRSDQPSVGRPGGDGVPRQLEHRAQPLPQRLRARAQPLRGRVPEAGGGDRRRRLGPPSSRAARPHRCAIATSGTTSCSRWRGS